MGLGFVCILASEWVILTLYGRDYPLNPWWMLLFAVGGVGIGVIGLYGWLLNALGQSGAKLHAGSEALLAVINIALNVWLIPVLGVAGAITSTIVAYGVAIVVMRWWGRPHFEYDATAINMPGWGETACDGHREVVTAWENGLMCPVDHVSAMVEGLRMLLGDHALRHRLAQGSRKRRDLYDWRRIAIQHLQVLQQVPVGAYEDEAMAIEPASALRTPSALRAARPVSTRYQWMLELFLYAYFVFSAFSHLWLHVPNLNGILFAHSALLVVVRDPTRLRWCLLPGFTVLSMLVIDVTGYELDLPIFKDYVFWLVMFAVFLVLHRDPRFFERAKIFFVILFCNETAVGALCWIQVRNWGCGTLMIWPIRAVLPSLSVSWLLPVHGLGIDLGFSSRPLAWPWCF